jgi:hypothetical protein
MHRGVGKPFTGVIELKKRVEIVKEQPGDYRPPYSRSLRYLSATKKSCCLAWLCFNAHAQMENRNGLIVGCGGDNRFGPFRAARAFERRALRLLVASQDQSLFRRIEIEPDHIPGVALELLVPWRARRSRQTSLDVIGCPRALDAGFGQASHQSHRSATLLPLEAAASLPCPVPRTALGGK